MIEDSESVHWHALDAKAVLERLDSGDNALDEAQAEQRLEEAGPNSLEAEEGVNPLRLLARQVNNPLVYLLIGAAVLSFVVGHRVDAGVIVGVVILNTLWGMAGAYREMPQGHNRLEKTDVESGLTLAGLWGMLDPPRAPEAFIVDRRALLRVALLMPIMPAGTLGLFCCAGQPGKLTYA